MRKDEHYGTPRHLPQSIAARVAFAVRHHSLGPLPVGVRPARLIVPRDLGRKRNVVHAVFLLSEKDDGRSAQS